jgi:hypothetical protein
LFTIFFPILGAIGRENRNDFEYPMTKRQYPNRAKEYQLLEQIGNGATAIVHRALCVPFDEIVAVKIVDLERSNGDLVMV